MRFIPGLWILGLLLLPVGCTQADDISTPAFVPAAGWDHRAEASDWTEATLRALDAEGAILVGSVPSDIGDYCPNYANAQPEARKAFWVGLLSVVAKHESGWNPQATGGGGRFLGLLQISRPTAQAHGCAEGEALLDGAANLSCGVRIIAGSVSRDGAVFSDGERGWLGIARDWLPFRDRSVRQEVADWSSRQSYCN